MKPLFVHDVGIVCALGQSKVEVWRRASAGDVSGVAQLEGDSFFFGRTQGDGVPVPEALWRHNSRNNRLLLQAFEQIRKPFEQLRTRFGSDRIAVVLGTSTSGIEEGLRALDDLAAHGQRRNGAHYHQQEIGSPSVFLSRALGLTGPAYTVSTACTSSARVFATVRRLLSLGLADAAIVGGSDSLARLTVSGFDSLASLSANRCNPLSRNRDGLSIGDGAAVFLVSNEPGAIALCGAGSCSDAHHMSAPDPEGQGAAYAMRAALADAGLQPGDIDYVNLHGTATPLNDAMETKALTGVFAASMPACGSTKPMTGHALGAAGAIELALCWLALSPLNAQGVVPPHVFDGELDAALPAVNFATAGARVSPKNVMSNSFAFGGNNVSLVLRRLT